MRRSCWECSVFYEPDQPDRATPRASSGTAAVLGLVGFVGLAMLVYAVGLGFTGAGGAWFGSLLRPAWLPANAVLAPYAGLAYVGMGAAGWRVWARSAELGLLRQWGWQLLLNACWAPSLFGLHSTGAGLVLIVPSLFASLGTVRRLAVADARAGLLAVPYVFWIVYATALSAGYWWLNGR